MRLAWVDKEGVVQYESPGMFKCRKCGGEFVSVVSPPVACGSCNRVTDCDPITPPVVKELWTPYGDPVVFSGLDLLFPRVAEFVKDCLVLRDDQEAIVLTLWIIASYKSHCFDTVPYLQFLGSVESGKTRALEVLGLLAYRAVNCISVSPSALCRAIEHYKPTLLLDQAEMKFNLKSERGCEMYDIFMSGYKKGERYLVAKKDDDYGLVSRDVFGFKAVASTRVFDEAFTSRSILFHMKQGLPKVKKIGAVERARACVLRDMLLYYGLRNDVFPVLDLDLTGRRYELYYSLFTVGKEFGITPELVEEYLVEDKKQMAGEMSDSIDADILREIQTVLHMIDEHEKIRVKDIADRLDSQSRIIGYRLKSMNIQRKHGHDGAYVDFTDKKTMDELSYLFTKFHIDGD